MDDMLKAISKYENGTFLKITWSKQECVIGGIIDTIYETCNEYPEESVLYEEYYACAFRVEKIYKNSNINIKINELIEISKYNSPDEIELGNGLVIWNTNSKG